MRADRTVYAGAIAVNDRILRRIFTFAGLPTVLGFALFPLFYWVKVWVNPVKCLPAVASHLSLERKPSAGAA